MNSLKDQIEYAKNRLESAESLWRKVLEGGEFSSEYTEDVEGEYEDARNQYRWLKSLDNSAKI